MTEQEFTPEHLYKQAQGNLTGVILGTIAYVKGQGPTPQDWVTFLGTDLPLLGSRARARGPWQQ